MNMINWRKPQDLILITFTVAFLEKSLTAPFSYYWYQFLVLLVISIGFKFYDYQKQLLSNERKNTIKKRR